MFSGKGNAVKPEGCYRLSIMESLPPWSLGHVLYFVQTISEFVEMPLSPEWSVLGDFALGCEYIKF